ncbi:MAG: peptidyl-prolyl cis-trans isomerase [Candidatus Omnitrophica bacterium]|nr:peptidyl-prolyl cis-trans isomerase [Candidatus Omnitrophota bacterium]
MLRQLRKRKIMKRVLWTVAILIIPPFVFWGGGSALRSRQKGPAYAGIIFGQKISFKEYGDAWQATKNQAIMIYGPKLNEVYESLNLDQQAWERLILLKEVKRRKIKVSDSEVIDTIQNFPFFQSKGRFDKRAYDLILRQIFKIEARQFEEEIRDALSITKLRDTIIKDVIITDEEVKWEYKKENEKASLAYILISPISFKKYAKIQEDALKNYYRKNIVSFRVGEQVNIDYLGFEFSNYQKNISVNDEDVRSYYESHKDEFDPQKKFEEIRDIVKNRLIQEKAKESALMAAEKIDYILADKNKSFEEVAKEYDILVKETGFFGKEGLIPQIGWFPEIQKIAFTLNVGERSELIRPKMGFAKGYYIIKIKEKKPPYIQTYEEVKEQIENLLKEEEAARLAFLEAQRLHKKIEDLMKTKNIKFDEAILRIKRKLKYTEPFTRNGYIQGVGSATEFGEIAFNTKPGEVSPIIKAQAGFCIFTVIEIIPIDEEKFAKEKEDFTKRCLEAKKSRILNEWYYLLIEKANLKSNIPLGEM